MNTKTENMIPVQLPLVEGEDTARSSEWATDKKLFVEPAISFPVDVLEATTFFQVADSGGLS